MAVSFLIGGAAPRLGAPLIRAGYACSEAAGKVLASAHGVPCSVEMNYRSVMREHVDAISRAIEATDPTAPVPGFLAQRAALLAADTWLRGLDSSPEPELATRFGLPVLALLLAVEDVLRLWPDDPGDDPAPWRFGQLTARLLPQLRALVDDGGGPAPNEAART